MRTHERVTIALLIFAGVLALAGPRVQVVLTVAVLVLLTVATRSTPTLILRDRTGGAMSSGFVSGGSGIAAGHPAAADAAAHHWVSARADPSIDGGSFSLAAGASPHPT
ncbi:hypothetical protein LWC34_43485 [Kibdelosporangium philippinense]|uniref:Uncharacterized protein n=1 Tax=Kibdelosporangium philippinense TaxID=211113 RepID=A0ABS8ZRP5_9PSEU|nr:hypothetical protein [Kibdelosporangium philippinense]MCE7009625.1 hypothetical protein [Kibdelosporangium philippinense]